MKKAVAIIFLFILCLSLFACKNKEENEITNDIAKKIAETLSSNYYTEKIFTVEVKQIGSTDELYVPFSDEDSKTAAKIINKYEPKIVETGPDCLFDFRVRIDGVEYSYHYDCGSFENESSGIYSELHLSDEDREKFNKILFNYVPHTNFCVIAEDISLNAEEPKTTRCLYDVSDLCFDLKKTTYGAANFAVNIFKEAIKTETNALISPVSLISALSMTANGAKGETLSEIEKVLGADIEQLNNDFSKASIDGEGIKTANSIWFKDSPALKIKQGFIDINKKHYGAEIHKENFGKSTLNKINRWVSDNTDGLIKNGLDELQSDAVMYLINTVLFDAEWKTKFNSNQVLENQNFTSESGEIQIVTMLSDEFAADEYNYFKLGKTEGIIMDYTNGCSFAALLPNEGVTVSQALDSFTGNQLVNMLTKRLAADKNKCGTFLLLTKIPKFNFNCSFKFADTLAKLGMPRSFNPTNADFSGICDTSLYPLYISQVYHNTSVSLTENGTKAGAATYVEMKFGSAKPPESTKKLYFDRPFIYVIFKTDSGIPIFMGTVRDFNK